MSGCKWDGSPRLCLVDQVTDLPNYYALSAKASWSSWLLSILTSYIPFPVLCLMLLVFQIQISFLSYTPSHESRRVNCLYTFQCHPTFTMFPHFKVDHLRNVHSDSETGQCVWHPEMQKRLIGKNVKKQNRFVTVHGESQEVNTELHLYHSVILQVDIAKLHIFGLISRNALLPVKMMHLVFVLSG